ncbi:MAG: metalloregulator ArsR/SmtB family transcription factor [Christensenellales bacterium]
MISKTLVLKAIADETRMKIISLLLRYNYCVRALARKLELSEGAVSQHLKVLRDAGLLIGERKGYFMHYDVNRDVLYKLAAEIESLAAIGRKPCTPDEGGCRHLGHKHCRAQKQNCGLV